MTAPARSARWIDTERRRRRAMVGPLLAVTVGLVTSLGSSGATAIAPVALLMIAALLVAVAGLLVGARRRMAGLAAGERWAGAAAVDISDLRRSRLLAPAAPKTSGRASVAFVQGTAPGVLHVGDAGIGWTPGRLARRHGAQAWTVRLDDVVAVEAGRYTPPFVSGVLVWFADGTSVSFQTQVQHGLADALRLLDLDRLPIAFAEATR